MQFRPTTRKIGDFMIGKTIGQGTFGKVKQGIHMPSGRKVAIKILQKGKINMKDDLSRVHNELKILYNKVDHPNIIKLLELHQSDHNIYIVTEFIEGKQLYQLIVEQGNLEPELCGIYFCQLIDTITYLHSLGICHRDIKPENIMVNGNYLKLIDFGLSKEFGQNSMLWTSCGSPCYAAPEMLKRNKYDCIKSDIWAMGVTLYAMSAGRLPFQDENTQRLYQKINVGKYQWIDYKKILNNLKPDKLFNENERKMLNKQVIMINSLLQKLLQVQPNNRPSLIQINNSEWVKYNREKMQKNKIKIQYENDEILINSMSKYFKKDIQQLRSILQEKSIASICTYYNVSLRQKVNPMVNNKKIQNQHERDLLKQNESKMKIINKLDQNQIYKNNPQSFKNKLYKNINTTTEKVKNKSLTLCEGSNKAQSSLLTKQILKQIKKQNINDVKQMNQYKSYSTAGNNLDLKQLQNQEQAEVHDGPFHLSYVFTNLNDVYAYLQELSKNTKHDNIANKCNRAPQTNFRYISNQIQQLSDEEVNDNDIQKSQQKNKKINKQSESSSDRERKMNSQKYMNNCQQHELTQEQMDDQYILLNSKYVLNSKPQPRVFLEDNLSKQKCMTTKCIEYLSKYTVSYKGTTIKIKKLNNKNSSLFYLELPPFFSQLPQPK